MSNEQIEVCFKIDAETLAKAENVVRREGTQLSDYVIHTIEILAATGQDVEEC